MAFLHHRSSVFALEAEVEAGNLDSVLRDKRAWAIVVDFLWEVVLEVLINLVCPIDG
jgi:hypothetical protein